MKDAFRDYLVELVSGFVNIALLGLDFLGIILLFWPVFPRAQLIGLCIFILSFGAANYRIYLRQRKLLESYEEKRAKRLSVLRALLGEIQNNAACGLRNFARQSSDDVWQHVRDEIHWLPADLQEQLHAYYRTLCTLQAEIREYNEDGTLDRVLHFPYLLGGEDTCQLVGLKLDVESFIQSFNELPQALQEQIDQLKVEDYDLQ